MRRRALERVAPTLDIVEIFNAREIASSSNVRALEFARRHDLPGGVGSDSHRPIEIGRAYIEVASFTGDAALLTAGVHAGERVVTLGVQKLGAGQKVRVVEAR